jgi:hypothetical protein
MKYSLNTKTSRRTKSKSQTEIANRIDKSTPLTHAFAERIMRKYMSSDEEEENKLTEVEQNIQEVFSTFPKDDLSKRLAKIVGAITGFEPEIITTARIGDTFVYNGVTYACVAVMNNQAVCISDNCAGRMNFGFETINSYPATQAQTSLFAKNILTVPGQTLYGYVVQICGVPAAAEFAKTLGVTLDI